MTPPVKHTASADAARAERELLARLGLNEKAVNGDLDAAHADLAAFLEGAPASLGTWAKAQIAAADEAYALLSDPEANLAAIAAPAAPAAASERRAGIVLSNRALVALALVAAAVVLGIVVYKSGGSSTAAAPPAQTAPTDTTAAPQLDKARVEELTRKVVVNPKDVASLETLGEMYFQAGDYNAAGGWMAKVIALEPKNVKARLALGAAHFNLGNAAAAEKEWKRVVQVDPKNVEAYYDLGFLYLSKTPRDAARAKAAWSKVVELAPDSEVAQTVATHLKGLDGGDSATGTKGK